MAPISNPLLLAWAAQLADVDWVTISNQWAERVLAAFPDFFEGDDVPAVRIQLPTISGGTKTLVINGYGLSINKFALAAGNLNFVFEGDVFSLELKSGNTNLAPKLILPQLEMGALGTKLYSDILQDSNKAISTTTFDLLSAALTPQNQFCSDWLTALEPVDLSLFDKADFVNNGTKTSTSFTKTLRLKEGVAPATYQLVLKGRGFSISQIGAAGTLTGISLLKDGVPVISTSFKDTDLEFVWERLRRDTFAVGHQGIDGMLGYLSTREPNDGVPPILVSTTPTDNASAVAPRVALELLFNEPVAAGTGAIVISNGTDTRSIPIQSSSVTITGTKVTIRPTSPLQPNSPYNVQLASGVIKDLQNNPFSGISNATTFNFVTGNVDAQAPLLLSTTPLKNAITFAPTANIELSFNEAVQKGSGQIRLVNTQNSKNTISIPVSDNRQVSITGNKVVINPSKDLTPNAVYSLQMAAGVIKDLDGNSFAGLTGNASLRFSTPSVVANRSTTLGSKDVSLLLTGNAAINGVGNALANTLIGNNNNNTLEGRLKKDTLIGGGGIADSDTFAYKALNESLLSGYDVIVDFNRKDRIRTPGTVAKASLTSSLGTVAALTAPAIRQLLTTGNFPRHAAVAFSASGMNGLFVALNNNTAGFDPAQDGLIFLQNFSGIGPSNPITIAPLLSP